MAVEMLVGLNVVDDEGYQSYRAEMTPILHRHGGGFGYDFRVAETLKAEVDAPINRVFTIYFPDEATMTAFFSNDEYSEAKRRHFERSVSHSTIIARYDRQPNP